MTRRSSANCSAAPAPSRPVEQGLRAADRLGAARRRSRPARASASSRGVSREPGGQARGASASRPRHHPGGEGQLLGHVGAHEPAEDQRAGHVGHQAPVDLADRQLGVGVHDADVGAERDLDAAAERVAVHGGDDRDRDLLPHPGHLLAEVGDAPVGHRRRVAGRPRRSRRPGRRRPSAGTSRSRGRRRTTAPRPTARRSARPGSVFSRSPASARARNMAPSRALRFSGRFRRTSATPASTDTVTRSDMGRVSHACQTRQP